MGYAHDFVIFSVNFIKMVKKIKVTENYCDLNLLKINTDK